jgi:hypothetical protein
MHTQDRPGERGDVDAALAHLRRAERDLAQGDDRDAKQAVEEAIRDLQQEDPWVVVNGRRRDVDTERLTFDAIIALAFPDPPKGDGVQFTVQYTRGPEQKPNGSLVEGQSVEIRSGMEFDVTPTNRS